MGFLSKLVFPQTLGIVVTASHNPMKDNGIKLVDTNGGMLRIGLEPLFDDLVNTSEFHIAAWNFQQAAKKFFDAPAETSLKKNPGRVFIGQDTRVSSPEISYFIQQGLRWTGAEIVDFGEQTTPQVH